MSRFHAILRVRIAQVAEATPDVLARLSPDVRVTPIVATMPAGCVLVPLWTTIADHDGAPHTMAGDECSLAICDLGGGSARDAEELWAARRAMLPFLAAVPHQGTPPEVRDAGIVDQSRARLAHLAADLGRAGDLQSPLLSLTVGDVRALRWLVIAEMGRIAPVVAQSAAETAPAPSPADAPVYVHPDSPLERVARALGVAATEESMIAEAHRLHGALAAQRGHRENDDRIRSLLGAGPDDDLVAHVRGRVDSLGEIASALGVRADQHEIMTAIDSFQARAAMSAAAAERPPPPDWSGRRSQAFGAVAARLGVEAEPAAVLAAIDNLIRRANEVCERATEIIADVRDQRAADAADQEIADDFLDALIEASADRVAEIVTGRGK